MFFVPVAILVIEDEDDRTFMEMTAAFASYIRIFFKNGIFAINIAAQNEITTVRLISKLRS